MNCIIYHSDWTESQVLTEKKYYMENPLYVVVNTVFKCKTNNVLFLYEVHINTSIIIYDRSW